MLRRRARDAGRRAADPRASVDQAAGRLSGGNQQKVVFAKWLDASPSVVLLDDPTRGVDVGAKAEMHALIRSTAEAGAPVLICSTDIDELASLCDRVVVLHQGRVSAELAGSALRTHAVLEAMNQGSNVVVLSDDDLEQQRRLAVLEGRQDLVERAPAGRCARSIRRASQPWARAIAAMSIVVQRGPRARRCRRARRAGS